jgi:hypothetical protein
MKAVRYLVFAITALSLWPVAIAALAYGNTIDLIMMILSVVWFVILLISIRKAQGVPLTATSLLIGLSILIYSGKSLFYLYQESGVYSVSILFTVQLLFIATALYLSLKDLRA